MVPRGIVGWLNHSSLLNTFWNPLLSGPTYRDFKGSPVGAIWRTLWPVTNTIQTGLVSLFACTLQEKWRSSYSLGSISMGPVDQWGQAFFPRILTVPAFSSQSAILHPDMPANTTHSWSRKSTAHCSLYPIVTYGIIIWLWSFPPLHVPLIFTLLLWPSSNFFFFFFELFL